MAPVRANMPARQRRLLSRGVTALEFALVSPIAILVIFFALEIGIMTWADATLEVTSARISRMGQLGKFTGEDCTEAVRKTLDEGIGYWVQDKTALSVDVRLYEPGDPPAPAPGDDGYQPECNAGDRGDMVIYRLSFDRPSFTGIISWLNISMLRFERTIIIQNEP